MKIIFETFIGWLDHEIKIADNLPEYADYEQRQARKKVLIEVKTKLEEVMHKIFSEAKDA